MLGVAGGNLHKALQRVKRSVKPIIQMSRRTHRTLWLLRNHYEHWDELQAAYRKDPKQLPPAGVKLKREFPDADPWSFTFDPSNGDILLAGVVSLNSLVADLKKLDRDLVRFRRKLAPSA